MTIVWTVQAGIFVLSFLFFLWWNSEFQQCEWVCVHPVICFWGLHRMTDGYYCFSSRVKMAEECFKQAREKASYNVKPKHATGIVCLYTSYHSYCTASSALLLVNLLPVVLALFFFLPLSLQLADSVSYKHLSGCWRNNSPSSYSNTSRWVPVLPAVNNSDPFLYSTESKAGSEDLKQRMENDHHQAYCTSTVCTIWQWLISHFYNLYLLPVFVFNWFRPVIYCELVQSGYYVDVILFKSGMKNYILSHPLIALA